MAQFVDGKTYEKSNMYVELTQGPEAIASIKKAFNEAKKLDFMMLPWVFAGDKDGTIPVLIGDWPILSVSVSAAKCVSLDAMQWIIEGMVIRDLTQKAKETAEKNIDLVSPDNLTCFYAGAYVVLYYDVVASRGGVFLVKTGEKHERFFMFPQLPHRNVPDLWTSAVVPRKLLAYDLETGKVVEVEDYSPYTLAKMPTPSGDEDGQSAGDTEEDAEDEQDVPQGAESGDEEGSGGAGEDSDGHSGDEDAANGGGEPKKPRIGIGIVGKR